MARLSLAMGLLSVLAITPSQAHTWIEDAHIVAGNGSMIGSAGYPRGNVLRSNAVFDDSQMTYLIPPNGRSTGNAILPTDRICKASQTIGNQTEGSPALSASPGDMIALRYQENGHVTLPQNQPGKPANRGTVFIYGTSKSSNSDTLLSIHKVWNAEGTGGDGRGVLLATQNFDDRQCYQVNSGKISQERQAQFSHTAIEPMGVNVWCQSDFTIPSSVDTNGQYTVYWVWDWPTAPGTPGQEKGLNELYTSCLDITMVKGTGTSKSLHFEKGQDLNFAAISTELATPYVVTTSTSTKAPASTGAASEESSDTAPGVNSATETAAQAGAKGTATAAGSAGMVTVTVEASPIKEYITITQTIIPGQASATPATSSSTQASAPHIQPFAVGQGVSTTKSLEARATDGLRLKRAANATIRGRVVRIV